MGSSTLIDILGAMLIGSILMLNTVRVFHETNDHSWIYASESIVQTNLVDVTTLIERDFLRIGYQQGAENLAHVVNAIEVADRNRIVFRADMDNNGSLERVEYSAGNPKDLGMTINPADVPFIRRINGVGDAATTYGVVEFTLEYFNYIGEQLSTPVNNRGEIATISITIACENPDFSDSEYAEFNAKAFYKQMRLAIPNLRFK